jgi:aminoglycoside phosphotransferase family enzyme
MPPRGNPSTIVFPVMPVAASARPSSWPAAIRSANLFMLANNRYRRGGMAARRSRNRLERPLRPIRMGCDAADSYAARMSNADTDLRAKINWLSRPEAYPDNPLAVEAIETHFAWIFLAGRFAYKMKKPLKFRELDLTTLATRRANCELEVALNRRLAPTVYLGAVPLYGFGTRLSLARRGTPVEWLVKMHRLPRERALDRLAATGRVADSQLRALLEQLARFYSTAVRAPWDGRAYRQAITHEVERTARELSGPTLGLDAMRVDRIAGELLRRLAAQAPALHDRVADGRVVDAHGDLRPEHVFLLPEPQVIDCLEFSAELRLLDSAAEIAFLALECQRLGQPELGRRVLAHYREYSHDGCDPELLELYRAWRAVVRAKVAAWHLEDRLSADARAYWRNRANWYLEAAAASLDIGEHCTPIDERTIRTAQ